MHSDRIKWNSYSFLSGLYPVQLLSIQHGIECVGDHLTEGIQLVDKLQEPQTDLKG